MSVRWVPIRGDEHSWSLSLPFNTPARVGRLKNNALVRNSGWVFVGQALRLGTRMVYFVLIARELGPSKYGALAAVLAYVAIVAPFSSWGAGNLLIRAVARDKRLFHVYWGNGLLMLSFSSAALLVVLLLVRVVFLPNQVSFFLVLTIGLAELFFTRLQELSGQAFQGFERLRRTSQLWVLMGVARVLGALVMVIFVSRPSPESWGLIYLAASAVVGLFSLLLVQRELGHPRFKRRLIKAELRDGFYFATSYSAATVYGDVDKVMLADMKGLFVAGTYAASYRLVEGAFVPVISVLHAAYPRIFLQGHHNLSASAQYAVRFLRICVPYALAAAAFLFVSAPFVHHVLGEDYVSIVGPLRWLALIPVLKSIHYFAGDALSGAGYQGLRTALQVSTAVLNIGLILWLVPRYSWRGAAGASLLSEAFLACSFWIAIATLRKRPSAQKAQRLP